MEMKRITTSDTDLYSFMERLLTQAFPPEEYRNLKQLREYTDHIPHFHNNIILQENLPVGFITYWNFDDFSYVEHFAVDPGQRNGGYGKVILNNLVQQLNRPIVLEVEIPDEEMAVRRINFYKRQGFELWENPYMQPPYKEGDNFLPMLIMAHGNINSGKDFDNVKSIIHREVYNVKS